MPDWGNLAGPLGTIIGFVLTLMVFSYIFGDNVLFRLASHIFIGVAAGYAAVLVAYNIIYIPLLVNPGNQLVRLGPPLILGVWLLIKTSPRLSRLGNPVVAYLVGVGSAVAISGALLGTIFPLVDQSTRQLADKNLTGLIDGAIILVGTVTTLVYFHYGARPTPSGVTKRDLPIEIISMVGQVFIAITLGAIFAGVFLAVISVLIERLFFIFNFNWKDFISLFS